MEVTENKGLRRGAYSAPSNEDISDLSERVDRLAALLKEGRASLSNISRMVSDGVLTDFAANQLLLDQTQSV